MFLSRELRAFLFASRGPLFCVRPSSLDKNLGKPQDNGLLL